MNSRWIHARGFTLIELMIVVTVIAILAALALTAYTNQVTKGKRAEGKASLLQAAQIEERYYTANNQYGDLVAAGLIKGFSGDNATNAAYDITSTPIVTGGVNTGFTVSAVPDSFTDSTCGALSLTNTGVRGCNGISNTTCANPTCWH